MLFLEVLIFILVYFARLHYLYVFFFSLRMFGATWTSLSSEDGEKEVANNDPFAVHKHDSQYVGNLLLRYHGIIIANINQASNSHFNRALWTSSLAQPFSARKRNTQHGPSFD